MLAAHVIDGGRMVYLDQNPAAHLLFGAGRHKVSLFIFQDRGEPGKLRQTGSIRSHGFEVESWKAAGLRYLAISDASPQAVQALCNLIRSVQSNGPEP